MGFVASRLERVQFGQGDVSAVLPTFVSQGAMWHVSAVLPFTAANLRFTLIRL